MSSEPDFRKEWAKMMFGDALNETELALITNVDGISTSLPTLINSSLQHI